jgi:arsenite oxidase small subunit
VSGISTAVRLLASPSPARAQMPASSSTISSAFPRVKVVNLGDLTLNNPVGFSYPLDNEPNILVKLGEKAQGGIGPNSDIVAFSLLCQHQGCRYNVRGSTGNCPCHGSVYDLANGGANGGPAPRPVPQVILELDSSTGDIYATGMTPPTIYGHNTGSDDVSYDLQGGTLVPEFPSHTFPFLAAVALAIGMAFTRRKFREKGKPTPRRAD